MKLTFCGAAGEVTGSQHLIECGKLRVLLDCGLFQGHRAEARRKNEEFRCRPSDLDAVILSHAHIDHCGNLPRLFRKGYRGPVYCTEATGDIAGIMLEDSLKIQLEDVKYLRRKQPKDALPIDPLYDERDLKLVMKHLEPRPYGKWFDPFDGFKFRFRDAGHILGSAITEMELMDKGEIKRVVFTGDLGRRGLPLTRDPELVNGCDVLIIESTYANRVHAPADDLKRNLLRIIQTAFAAHGKVIIPAFSLGRTQSVVYFLNELVNSGELPRVPVYVDSPLSYKLTQVYSQSAKDVLDEQVQETLQTDADPFHFEGLTYIRTQEESIALNRLSGPMVIIAASGMCESGRVLHHLKQAVGDPQNTIVIIGFQAENTLGRRIVEKQPTLRIYDRHFPLRANVEILNGLSAHADAEDFKWWLGHMGSTTGIGQAFLVHGEDKARTALTSLIRDFCDEDAISPKLYESFEV